MITKEFLITASHMEGRDLSNRWIDKIYGLFDRKDFHGDFIRSLIDMNGLSDAGAVLRAGFLKKEYKDCDELWSEDLLDKDKPYIYFSIEHGKHPACPDHLLFDRSFNPGPEGEKWSRFRIKTNMFSYDNFDYPEEYIAYPARRPSDDGDYTKEKILSHPVMLMDQMTDEVADKSFYNILSVISDNVGKFTLDPIKNDNSAKFII